MSVHVISWVLENSDEKLAARLVLLVLADHARKDGSMAWPDVETIASEARIDRRTAQRCLRGLEMSSAITRTGISRAGTTIWQVNMGGRQYVTPDNLEGAASDPLTGGTPPPEPSLDQPSVDLAPAARPRDLVWDELERRFGTVVEKTNAHAKRNKAVADLKRQDATVQTIRLALRAWPIAFPGATVTDQALATHFVQLIAGATASRHVDSVEKILDLPEVSDEQRRENLGNVRQLAERIGR